MNVLFNNENLVRLINDMHTLTGMWANIFDADCHVFQMCGVPSRFCSLVNGSSVGRARCSASDAQAVKRCASSRFFYMYRCHAGLCELLLPIYEGGKQIAYLVLGQMLDDSPISEQWENTLRTLKWYRGDMDEMHEAFLELEQYSAEKMSAYINILKAITSHIQMEGYIRSAEYTDQQKLEIYINQHYTENLSLKKIASDLNMGTTKLCLLAKKLSGDKTLTQIITSYRIEFAKALLVGSSMSISKISSSAGFSDYNYFAKVFKSQSGLTPSEFRKASKNGQTTEE